jgi:hypothetical protein
MDCFVSREVEKQLNRAHFTNPDEARGRRPDSQTVPKIFIYLKSGKIKIAFRVRDVIPLPFHFHMQGEWNTAFCIHSTWNVMELPNTATIVDRNSTVHWNGGITADSNWTWCGGINIPVINFKHREKLSRLPTTV